MELNDCAFPLLNKVVATDDAKVAFRDSQVALLVGARPRGPGMERKDLLLANAQIFSAQGKAMNEVADRNIKVLVVGNPANTNALIARANAKDLNPRNFTAMTRLDHNRALSQLAAEDRRRTPRTSASSPSGATTPPRSTRTSRTQPSPASRRSRWSTRSGSRRPSSRWCSSAARPSSRRAALLRPLQPRPRQSITSTPGSRARRMATGSPWQCPSDGSYGIKEGVIYSYPVTTKNGEYAIVQGLAIDEFSRKRMDASDAELREERDGVKDLL